ncbi:RING-H2 finger protein ATL63 [Quercus lobata]|uniref:RING-type E3 ubiquitin transferase n=2 Tax=Quercus TaxID=3511 RepID=A0A7N2KQ42_QUELO|nr:RING-H2 finger protein ATL63 [Quercus lobata]
MLSPPDSPNQTNSLSRVFKSIFSYDGNVMLAAVISLLLVILLVLLLHVYAKWFLAQSRDRRRRRSITVSHVLGPSRFHHFHTFNFDTSLSNSSTKGLDASVIATIPLFVYKSEEHKNGLECVICLSPFEENDVGRDLPKCHHGFHVECIDMWLSSHANCPICRALVVSESEAKVLEAHQDHGNSSAEVSLERVEVSLSEHGNSHSTLGDIIIDIPSCENNRTENIGVTGDSLSVSSPSSSLGCSLKRMLSRNKSDRKVFPSSNANQLGA